MSKPLKYVVAIAAKSDRFPGRLLLVKRPDDDPDLRGSWGLPAVTVRPEELPEEAARRVCREKLGCNAQPLRFLGVMFQKRNSYDLCLMDLEVQIIGDDDPDVKKATTQRTTYVAQKWTDDPLDLLPAAKHGSCCASLYLSSKGLLERDNWIESLEGSELVA